MIFSNTPPDKPGFYAWRYSATGDDAMVQADYLRTFNKTWFIGKEFCPLLPAEEVEKAWYEGRDTAGESRNDAWSKSNARKIVEGRV